MLESSRSQSVGEPFNPELHEAVDTEETDREMDGKVVEEYQSRFPSAIACCDRARESRTCSLWKNRKTRDCVTSRKHLRRKKEWLQKN